MKAIIDLDRLVVNTFDNRFKNTPIFGKIIDIHLTDLWLIKSNDIPNLKIKGSLFSISKIETWNNLMNEETNQVFNLDENQKLLQLFQNTSNNIEKYLISISDYVASNDGAFPKINKEVIYDYDNCNTIE